MNPTYSGTGIALTGNHAGPESLKILLDNLECSGDETTVFDCPKDDNIDCGHHEDAVIKCLNIPDLPSK